jgi:hypothetical protein
MTLIKRLKGFFEDTWISVRFWFFSRKSREHAAVEILGRYCRAITEAVGEKWQLDDVETVYTRSATVFKDGSHRLMIEYSAKPFDSKGRFHLPKGESNDCAQIEEH